MAIKVGSSLDRKINMAREAIETVFSDTTQPQSVTLAALEELQDCIASKIECIKGDLRRSKR